MNKKVMIVITILLLAIGFAIVSTTLVINGSIDVFKDDNIDVIYTSAYLDGVDIYESDNLSDDKKSITFTSKSLKNIGDKSILEYEITNKSEKSNVLIEVECSPLKQEYTSISNEIVSDRINLMPNETVKGISTITLNKSATLEKYESYTCKFTATKDEN